MGTKLIKTITDDICEKLTSVKPFKALKNTFIKNTSLKNTKSASLLMSIFVNVTSFTVVNSNLDPLFVLIKCKKKCANCLESSFWSRKVYTNDYSSMN